jgi:hypothetical protein
MCLPPQMYAFYIGNMHPEDVSPTLREVMKIGSNIKWVVRLEGANDPGLSQEVGLGGPMAVPLAELMTRVLLPAPQVDLKHSGLEGLEDDDDEDDDGDDDYLDGYVDAPLVDGFFKLNKYGARKPNGRLETFHFSLKEAPLANNGLKWLDGTIYYLPASAELPNGESRGFIKGIGKDNCRIACYWNGRLMPNEGVDKLPFMNVVPSDRKDPQHDILDRALRRCFGVISLSKAVKTDEVKGRCVQNLAADLAKPNSFQILLRGDDGVERQPNTMSRAEEYFKTWLLRCTDTYDKLVTLQGVKRVREGNKEIVSYKSAVTNKRGRFELDTPVLVKLQSGRDGFDRTRASRSLGQDKAIYGKISAILPPPPPKDVTPEVPDESHGPVKLQTCRVRFQRLPVELYGSYWEFDVFRIESLGHRPLPTADEGPSRLDLEWVAPRPPAISVGNSVEKRFENVKHAVEVVSGERVPELRALIRIGKDGTPVTRWTTDQQGKEKPLPETDGAEEQKGGDDNAREVMKTDKLLVKMAWLRVDEDHGQEPNWNSAVQGKATREAEGGHYVFDPVDLPKTGLYCLIFRVQGSGRLARRPFVRLIPEARVLVRVVPGRPKELKVRAVGVGSSPRPLDAPVRFYLSFLDAQQNVLPGMSQRLKDKAALDRAVTVRCEEATLELAFVGHDPRAEEHEVAVDLVFRAIGPPVKEALGAARATFDLPVQWAIALEGRGAAGDEVMSTATTISVCPGRLHQLVLDPEDGARHFIPRDESGMDTDLSPDQEALAVANRSVLPKVTVSFRDKFGLPALVESGVATWEIGEKRGKEALNGAVTVVFKDVDVCVPGKGRLGEARLINAAFEVRPSSSTRGGRRSEEERHDAVKLSCDLPVRPSERPHLLVWFHFGDRTDERVWSAPASSHIEDLTFRVVTEADKPVHLQPQRHVIKINGKELREDEPGFQALWDRGLIPRDRLKVPAQTDEKEVTVEVYERAAPTHIAVDTITIRPLVGEAVAWKLTPSSGGGVEVANGASAEDLMNQLTLEVRRRRILLQGVGVGI